MGTILQLPRKSLCFMKVTDFSCIRKVGIQRLCLEIGEPVAHRKKICYSSPKDASISLTTSILATIEASVSQLERKMTFTFLHVCLTMNQKHGLYLLSGIRIYEVSFYCYVIVCIGENKTKLMTFCQWQCNNRKPTSEMQQWEVMAIPNQHAQCMANSEG